MSELHIQRDHHLGLPQARQVAQAWAHKAQQKLGVESTYDEGDEQDTLHFTHATMSGTLTVTAERLTMQAQMGFLFSAFKNRAEAEIASQLDELLGTPPQGA